MNHTELCYANNPKSLFRKYARLVTWFANTKDGRGYLGDNFTDAFKLDFKDTISLFLPNGYIKSDGKNSQLTVTTRSIYSPKLYDALRVVDYFSPLSFIEQKKLLAYETHLLAPYSKLLPSYDVRKITSKFRWDSVTKNPDADPESTSVDGRVGRNATGTETWANIHDGAGDTAAPSTVATDAPQIIASTTSNRWDELFRNVTLFDTSSLTAAASKTSAVLSIYVTGKTTTLGSQSYRVVTCTPASNTNLVGTDYNIANWTATAQATDTTLASLSTSAYSDNTLNATGLGNVSLTGISKFGQRIVSDADNAEPTWGSGNIARISTVYADNGSNVPKLVINYSLGSGFFMFM